MQKFDDKAKTMIFNIRKFVSEKKSLAEDTTGKTHTEQQISDKGGKEMGMGCEEELRQCALEGLPAQDARFDRLFSNSWPLMPEGFKASVSYEPTRIQISSREATARTTKSK